MSDKTAPVSSIHWEVIIVGGGTYCNMPQEKSMYGWTTAWITTNSGQFLRALYEQHENLLTVMFMYLLQYGRDLLRPVSCARG